MDILLYTQAMHIIYSIGKHLTAYSINKHSHDYWELVCCTSGSGRFEHGDRITEYSAHEIVVIPPAIEHSNLTEEGFSNFHIIMDNLALPCDRLFKVADNPSRLLAGTFSQAYYIFNCDMPNKLSLLNILGDLIGNCLLNFINTPHYSPLVERIQSEIIKNFTDTNFNLKALLSEKAYSPDYVRKLFTKEMGVTPHQFLTDIRLNHAKKLLGSKIPYTKNVGEIARECGFADALYFSRLFKQHSGCSPVAYIDKQREI